MNRELADIYAIQELDTRIIEARQRLAAIPEELAALDQELQAGRDKLSGIREALETAVKNRRRLEQELESANAGVRKLQGQQLQVKTNKEYTAMLHEIELGKKNASGLEEPILQEMVNHDTLIESEKTAKISVEAAGLEIRRRQDVLRREEDAVTAKIAELTGQRDQAFGGLSRDLLALYKRVAQGRNGLAVVPVKGQACGGCFSNLPLQTINEIRKMENLITCETCGRILVWAEARTG